jgi:uncharacterized protein with HEPN domain
MAETSGEPGRGEQKSHLDRELKERWEELRTLRDDIRVRIHLAGMDVKDTWSKLEPRIQEFEQRLEEASSEYMDELKKRGHDLRERLKSLRNRISE